MNATCGRCGTSVTAADSIRSRATGVRYCREFAACTERSSSLNVLDPAWAALNSLRAHAAGPAAAHLDVVEDALLGARLDAAFAQAALDIQLELHGRQRVAA